MQKAGIYALLGIVVFALVFAFLPSGAREGAQTGARLSGVRLSLYPSRDPDAVWRFRAAQVTNDPVQGETHLTGLTGGERVIRGRTAGGQPTGEETVDATLTAPDLTIDAQDNLSTARASMHLVKDCADLVLTGTPQTPVRIEQGAGFSAPQATLDSPNLSGQAQNLRMSFAFVVEDSAPTSTISADLDTPERCVNGVRVRVPTSQQPSGQASN